MNGSGKQSFYEIQLSNSSLVVAFVIAVALGISVFVLGVMVGRGQAPVTLLDDGWVEQFPGDGAAVEDGVEDLSAGDLTAFDDVQTPVGGANAVEKSAGAVPAAAEEAEPADEFQQAGQTPPPATIPGLPANDPALASGWVVQVKATPDRAEADELQAVLASAGFPAFVVSEESRGQRLHKVRVGRYRDRADAQRVQVALGERGDVKDTWVTEG